jgi:hypothetical protein
MSNELIEKWLQHCKDAGHTTQAEASDQGKSYNPRKYAAYSLSPSGNRIYCALPKCKWQAEGKG